MATQTTFTSSQVEQQVLDIVRDLLNDLGREHAVSRVAPEASLEGELGIASLDVLELMLRCESRFGVKLDDSVAERAATPACWTRAVLDAGAAARARGSYTIRQPRREPPPAPVTADSFVEVLRRHAEFDADRVHVHLLENDTGKDISYGQLLTAASQCAAGLQALGLDAGQTVAIMLPTSADFFAAFFGVLLAGGTAVPIFPPADPGRIEEYVLRQVRVLRHAGIRFLITFDRVKVVSRLMRLRLSSAAGVVTVGALKEAGTGFRLRPADPAHYAVVQYTSGSTGDPKGVALTHANLLANVRAIGEAVRVRPGDAVVSWMPLYSDLGLIGTWLFSLYHAAPITVLSPLDFLERPERWLRAIHYSRGTLSAGPNFAYELCARKIPAWQMEGVDLSCWRVAVNAGEAVLPATIDRFCRRFAEFGFRREAFAAAYGLAENTVALAFPEPGRPPRIDALDRAAFERSGRALPAQGGAAVRYVSSGRPLAGHRVSIADERGQPLPERTQGRLLFRGPSRSEGYYRDPEATREALLPGGWMDSGDLAYLADGEIFFTGRRKECIIHEGRNLSPHDIETAAAEVPGVQPGSAAAFGVPDPASGTERIVVAAETLAYRPADIARVRAAVRHKLSEALALDVDVELTAPGAVPRTANGKVRRTAARALYLQGKLRAGTRPLWKQLASLWRGALAPGARRAARAGRQLARQTAGRALRNAVSIAAGAAARMGLPAALGIAAARFEPSDGLRLPPGALYVANRASCADVWALVAAARGHAALAGDAALLGLNAPARWALRPLVSRAADGLAKGRALLLLPDSAPGAPPERCRYRLDAFQAALAAAAPVIPVALAGSPSLRADVAAPARPESAPAAAERKQNRLTLVLGNPVPYGALEDAAALRDRARNAVADLLHGGAND